MTQQTVKIKRAADAATRLTYTPLLGELVIQLDVNTLWRGDGATAGGVALNGPTAGTVTSVALAAPATLLTVSGSPVTGTGTLTLALATQTANKVLAGPATGTAAPTFRSLAPADLGTGTATSAQFLRGDGAWSNALQGPYVLKDYTLTTLPVAATYPWGMIVVSNLTGGAEPCFSDGTNWRRCSDKSVAS